MGSLIFAAAALAEIAGCFMVWQWLRGGRSAWLLLPGVVFLMLFAMLLTRTGTDAAGRAYAAYGGVYVCAALLWLRVVEGRTPDRWDVIGTGLCLLGTLLIIGGPRG